MSNRIEILPIKLADNSIMHIETMSIGGEEDVSSDIMDISQFTSIIETFGMTLTETLKKVKPTKAQVEFGIEAVVESGKLSALLVKGHGKANLKITLIWENNEQSK